MASATQTRTQGVSGALARLRIDDSAFRAFQTSFDPEEPTPRLLRWFACWASGGRTDG